VDWDGEDPEQEDGEYVPVYAIEDDAVEREVALVALEAAALSRRIFPPGRSLSAHSRQALLALALVDPVMGLSAELIGHALALDHEEALEALAELVALGLVTPADYVDPEYADHEDAYGLTASGAAAAREIASAARRHLRGWPPG
jgi:hypothetical protein